MEQLEYMKSAPFFKSRMTTKKMMLWILLALLPTSAYAVFHFGIPAAALIAAGVVSAVGTEYAIDRILKRPTHVGNLKMAVQGLLFALTLPAGVPWWYGVLGGIMTSLLTFLFQKFIGRTLLNSALTSRCILALVFAEQMNRFSVDGISMATPLASLANGETVDTLNMVLGNISGCIGETSALALCMGAILLFMMGIIDLRVSGPYLLTFAGFLTLFGGWGLSSYYLTAQIAGGGFLLVLWFFANDFSTRPITRGGQIIYGIILGVLTGVFRVYWTSPEGICYAVLIANLLVPVIEKITIQKPFGVK